MKKTKFILTLLFMTGLGIITSSAQQSVVAAGGESTAPSGESMSHSAGLTDYIYLQSETASMQFGVQQVFDALLIIPGDANCDGVVNVLDIISIANYFVGLNPQPFCFENADINSDGVINVIDLIGTANIFTQGKAMPYANLRSREAAMTLNSKGIELQSDGTLAGLQFELTGRNINDAELKLQLPGHEIIYVTEAGVLRAMIYSFDNTPIPAGTIPIVSISNTSHLPYWGDVLAANLNTNVVPVMLYRDQATGISETGDVFNYAVYPNPAGNMLFVSLSGYEGASVSITLLNMHAQIISEKTAGDIHGSRIRFDLSGLPPGVYTVRINHGGSSYFEKVVKK